MFPRLALLLAIAALAACRPAPVAGPRPETPAHAIVACGERFPVARRVVLWTDPDGFNAYHDPPHHNDRLTRDEAAVAWSLDRLRRTVDQVVIHYDAAGSSRRCFEILQKRGLSAHFLIDTDGTIYQTLDLKERAWHAGPANGRSIGIEIAHVGATTSPTPGAIRGTIQNRTLYQQPYTDAQYDALADLLVALRRVCPRVTLTYPPQTALLSPTDFARHRGLIGHYHVSRAKFDPGPAFEWDRVIDLVQRRER